MLLLRQVTWWIIDELPVNFMQDRGTLDHRPDPLCHSIGYPADEAGTEASFRYN